MICFLRLFIGWVFGSFRSRHNLILENLALRQQLLALNVKRPRHRLSTLHKLFWIALPRLWSGWKQSLVLVTPRTVVAWHRAGFRLYWRWLSKARRVGGRTRVKKDVRALIFHMAAENPTWGAPRIHGELLKLGFRISEPTVSRWLRRARKTTDLLDHVIILNERHLKRLMTEYVRYYHDDRTHLGLAKDTPMGRPTALTSTAASKILSFPRLGGLHHRYAV